VSFKSRIQDVIVFLLSGVGCLLDIVTKKQERKKQEQRNQKNEIVNIKVEYATPYGSVLLVLLLVLIPSLLYFYFFERDIDATVVVLMLFFVNLYIVIDCSVIIKQPECPIFSWMGRERGSLTVGWHILLKPWEKIEEVEGFSKGRVTLNTVRFLILDGIKGIEFGGGFTEDSVKLQILLRVVNPHLVTYAATDPGVYTLIKAYLEGVARATFKNFNLEIITSAKSDQTKKTKLDDIAIAIKQNINRDFLDKFGFSIADKDIEAILEDIGLSKETQEARKGIRDSIIALEQIPYNKQKEELQIEIERLKETQQEIQGRAKGVFLDGVAGEGLTKKQAADFVIAEKKFANGVEDMTIIQCDGSRDLDGGAGATVLGKIIGKSIKGAINKRSGNESEIIEEEK